MPGPTEFAKLVPGFDFLQGLMKNAGQSIPNLNQWIAPTLDAEEVGKRIEQLRTVQFWLEQNARMLGTTIQALEVQRMTLSTLKNMDVPLDRMREAFAMTPPTPAEAPAPAPEASAPARRPPRAAKSAKGAAPAGAAGSRPGSPLADPMQWWNALTQQFTELASNALKETGAGVARNLAGSAPASASASPAPAPAKSARSRRRPA